MAKVLEPQRVPPWGQSPLTHPTPLCLPHATWPMLDSLLCLGLSKYLRASALTFPSTWNPLPRGAHRTFSLTSFSICSHVVQLLPPSVVGVNIEWNKASKALCTVPGTRLCLGAAVVRIITPWDMKDCGGLVVPTYSSFPSAAMEDLEFVTWFAGESSEQSEDMNPSVLLGAHQAFLTCGLIRRQPPEWIPSSCIDCPSSQLL